MPITLKLILTIRKTYFNLFRYFFYLLFIKSFILQYLPSLRGFKQIILHFTFNSIKFIHSHILVSFLEDSDILTNF